jgi:tyrosyl-tRNA synthetase
MKLSEELTKRGFVYQFSGESLAEVLDGEKRTVYLGIDPTADAIHIGNLVPFMMLNHIMNAGHNVVLLLGGGTALIGDPSGRDSERQLSDVAKIKEQADVMEAGVRKLATGDIKFVNNFDWLSKISAIDFMRDVGKHFTVNAMIKKDSVSTRMESEQGISYTEFSYSLLQSYDYYHLHQTLGTTLQIGGSDQWGNLISGVDYIRRTTGETVYALTMPLVVDKATGKKFGKSMGNAVWLSAHKTTPYELYQFWLNTSDESVIDYLKLFTFLSLEEIEKIAENHNVDRGARIAQKRLAKEVIAFVHGEDAVTAIETINTVLFAGATIGLITAEIKPFAPVMEIENGQNIVDVLVGVGLATSKREARTFVESGAVAIGDKTITLVDEIISKDIFGDFFILKRGKKIRTLVRVK